MTACSTCGIESGRFRYCGDDCKPRCSIVGCDRPVRKRTWCAGHYAQARRTGRDPVSFAYTWSPRIECLNCGSMTDDSIHRKYCSDTCRVAYAVHRGPRPRDTACVACGIEIDLMARGKRGQLQKSTTRLCRPCKRDYAKYKMSARELAVRDGTACGICGSDVDMSLSRADGLDCPSVDHILPRSRGGTHEPANLQLAHLRCNMLKSDRMAA